MPTDLFTRADAASLGANWTDVLLAPDTLGLRLVSNAARGLNYASSAARRISIWNADTPTADQYSEVVLGGHPSAVVLPGVRITGTGATVSGVFGYFDGFNSRVLLGRIDNGTFTTIGTLDAGPVTFASGDVCRLTVAGTTYTVTRNGTTIGSPVTDTTYATGTYGIGADYDNDIILSWTGGNVGGGGSSDATDRPIDGVINGVLNGTVN
jgi:hypothetical protein